MDPGTESAAVRHWSRWRPHPSGAEYTLGVEEELMLVHPEGWSLAHQVDRVISALEPGVAAHVTTETHMSALELATGVHETAGGAGEELTALRRGLDDGIAPLGLLAAGSGTHPFAVWHDTVVSTGDRQRQVYGSMRELARREPTFALHVHVGIADPERAIVVANRMRAHVPLLLALSANSPFWQGRDTGLASARTPLFQAFPRVGIPRAFGSYAEYVEAVDVLVRSGAFPEPTFLWWDVRPQPRLGTIEIRVMDAQATSEATVALVALVQCLVRLESEEGYVSRRLLGQPEVLEENRFLAARDGVEAELVDLDEEALVPLRTVLSRLLPALAPHAQELGCAAELAGVEALAEYPSARRQRDVSREPGRLPGLVKRLAKDFAPYPAL